MGASPVTSKVKPAKKQASYPPDFLSEPDLDFTTPYPCGVCRKYFRSRHTLATHPHKETR